MNPFLARIGIEWPIVQAPMAGVSTPAMAAAVSNAGALGSIGVGATNAEGARAMIGAVRDLSDRPLNVNVFCHAPARARPSVEAAWIAHLRPEFDRFEATAPRALGEIYRSFVEDDDMLAMLIAERPRVVSFHFGVPSTDRVCALRDAGILLLGSATSLAEARLLEKAGLHAIVAQGWEAGGHRGSFDPNAVDDQLGTMALTRILAKETTLPVIAAGGIMDGAGIAAAIALGASAAQLGTAFIGCVESSADTGFRATLTSEAAHHTTMTRSISGRLARCLPNRFTALDVVGISIPDYPIAYDAGKALHAAAKAKGEFGFGAQWAGEGAPLARSFPAADLVRLLVDEWQRASEKIDA